MLIFGHSPLLQILRNFPTQAATRIFNAIVFEGSESFIGFHSINPNIIFDTYIFLCFSTFLWKTSFPQDLCWFKCVPKLVLHILNVKIEIHRRGSWSENKTSDTIMHINDFSGCFYLSEASKGLKYILSPNCHPKLTAKQINTVLCFPPRFTIFSLSKRKTEPVS